MTAVDSYTSDHATLLAAASRVTGMTDLVSFQLDSFRDATLTRSTRGPVLPLDGMLIRDWDRTNRSTYSGLVFGARTYTIQDVKFVHIVGRCDDDLPIYGYDFYAVNRCDYAKLFRIAKWCFRQDNPIGPAPVLSADTLSSLIQNTVQYLTADNLAEIKSFDVKPKRGLLLTGPPGNGKTSACRYVWQLAQSKGMEYRIVSPDAFRAARHACDPAASVKELFQVDRAGIIFFDDLDLALRNRADKENPEDQAVFLSALDGIESNSGVVYVFTTNLSTDLIDPAFLRPGRIDAILHFPKPNAKLRMELMCRWAESIRNQVDLHLAMQDSDGMSFAEIEELKSLLVLRYIETRKWEWKWAINQFHFNRQEAGSIHRKRIVGFTPTSYEKTMESYPSVASTN